MVHTKELPCVELLREHLEYRAGHLYWRTHANNRSRAGTLAEGLAKKGYRRTSFEGRRYPTHRIIWSIHHGYLAPGLVVDHINRQPADNRIENLRAVLQTDNIRNSARRIDNRTGITGVRHSQDGRAWSAFFKAYGRNVYLGTFETKAEAIAVRRAVEHFFNLTREKATPEEVALAV